MSSIRTMLEGIEIPNMYEMELNFDSEEITDIGLHMQKQYQQEEILKAINGKRRVAVAVGSRGINCQVEVLRSLVGLLSEKGVEPFIIPAMGSHGGASAEGQRNVLKNLGVSETELGVPVISSMETVNIGNKDQPIYVDRIGYESDGIILVNRIKPHTSFKGRFESGLFKMAVIGLGKHRGALYNHSFGFENVAKRVEDQGRCIMQNGNILFGIGIVENAYSNPAIIEVLAAGAIGNREPELLLKAKSLMPRIPYDEFDILVVENFGKEFSGDGMDPNITGRGSKLLSGVGPKVSKYIVLKLSEASDGNATGIGAADFITREFYERIDFEHTYINSLTAKSPHAASVPMILENEEMAVKAAIFSTVGTDWQKARIVKVENTLDLGHIWVSESLHNLV